MTSDESLQPSPRPSCKGLPVLETKVEDFSGYLAQEGREGSIQLAAEWEKPDQTFSLKPLSPFLQSLKAGMEMTHPEGTLDHLPLTQCHLVPCHRKQECLPSTQHCCMYFTCIISFKSHDNPKIL